MTSLNPTTFTGVLARQFRQRYLRSLHEHRFFYDDIAEIGNPDTARHAIYFVPGINGTPGQMRFVLPSLVQVFGSGVYLKALHLPEFSAHVPTWDKYTPVNVDRKIAQLRADLAGLLTRFKQCIVICSSNGLYDFLAAAQSFDPAVLESRLQLVWGACAPDHIDPTPWEQVFFPLNGFTHAGFRWFAYPNHNAFTFVNPETCTSFAWADATPRRLHKVDLESRFRYGGLQWDYVSPGQLDVAVRHVVAQIRRPWRAPVEALIAANDGYWHQTPQPEIERAIRRYVPHANCIFKPESHLWVVNPSNVTELFFRLRPRIAEVTAPRSWAAARSATFATMPGAPAFAETCHSRPAFETR